MKPQITIGTMLRGNGGKAPQRVKALSDSDFETFQLHWWAGTGNEDLLETARVIREMLAGEDQPKISALGLYGNPLRTGSEGENARSSINQLIETAELFDCNVVGLFTGRIPGRPWEDSLKRFSDVFEIICRKAAAAGVTLVLENCPMGGNLNAGNWNLAFGPNEWTRLFESLSLEASGVLALEWEPAHQIELGNNPLIQLREWVDRIIHVHGKDAFINDSGVAVHCLPGRGQTDWAQVFDILEQAGFDGSIDIEGYHDPQWTGDQELPGQLRSWNYLEACRSRCHSGPIWPIEGD